VYYNKTVEKLMQNVAVDIRVALCTVQYRMLTRSLFMADRPVNRKCRHIVCAGLRRACVVVV